MTRVDWSRDFWVVCKVQNVWADDDVPSLPSALLQATWGGWFRIDRPGVEMPLLTFSVSRSSLLFCELDQDQIEPNQWETGPLVSVFKVFQLHQSSVHFKLWNLKDRPKTSPNRSRPVFSTEWSEEMKSMLWNSSMQNFCHSEDLNSQHL